MGAPVKAIEVLSNQEHDEDPEEGADGSTGWRLAVWGGGLPGGPDRPQRRGDWTRRSRDIWGVAPASRPSPETPEPILPLIELAPADVEDIIPLPVELAPAPIDANLWGAVDHDHEPQGPDIWGAGRTDRPPDRVGARYSLPERWDAGPRRRSLLDRWWRGQG